MIFIMNTEGTITAVTSSPLYQGSSDVNKIVLLAPFASTSPVIVSFRLPNGQYVYPYFAGSEGNADNPYRMVLLETFSGKFFTEDGRTGYNAWSINVDYPLTQYPGVLTIQFAVGVGNGYLTSSTTMNTVERGNEYLPPSIADDEALATLNSAVTAAQLAASNAQTAEASADDYAGFAMQDAHKAERYAVGEQDGVEVEGGIGYQNNSKYYAEQAAQSVEDVKAEGRVITQNVEELGASYVAQCRGLVESLNALYEDFNQNVGDVEAALDEIIALQDYYTGATFDELHAYAEAIEQGGVT